LLLRVPQRFGAALAAVAVLALVVTPLVHAEQHVQESSAQEHRHAHGGAPHRHSQPQGHSHGGGAHGSGSLQHLDVALLAAVAIELPLRQPPPLVRLAARHVQLHLIPDYLSPDRSQGPPASSLL